MTLYQLEKIGIAHCVLPPLTTHDDGLIPEYTYGPQGHPMNEGAIFMIDSQGNEYLAAVWNPRTEKFKEVL